MKPSKANPFRFNSRSIAAISIAFISHLATPSATAAGGPFYWDNNGGTAGFGTPAAGTWSSAGTVGSATQGWNTVATGTPAPSGTITTDNTDSLNFGTGTTGNGLGAGTITVSGTVNAGNLTFGSQSGNITFSGTLGTAKVNLAATSTINTGGKTITFSDVSLNGSSNLTYTGGGVLAIKANSSTLTGDLFVLNGILRLFNPSSGSGNLALGGASGPKITLGNTSGSSPATLEVNNSITIANAIAISAGSSGLKTLGLGSAIGATYSGAITASDNLRVLNDVAGTGGSVSVSGTGSSIASGKTVTWSHLTSGAINDTGTWSGAGSFSYSGTGNLGDITVAGANKTYSGGATLGTMNSTGNLVVNASSSGPANAPTNGPFGTGTLTIGATKMRAKTSDRTIANPILFNGNPTFDTDPTETSLIFSGNADLGAATRTLTVSTGTSVVGKLVNFSGAISSATAASGITKAGAGTLTLSGANTYTGNTTVTGGTLNITGVYTGDNTASALILGSTAANTVVNVSNDMTLYRVTGANISGSATAYNQTAGTVNTSLAGVGNAGSYVSNSGYGYFNLTGGTFKSNGSFSIGTNTATSNAVAYVGGTGFLDWSGSGNQTVAYASGASLTVGPGGSVSRGASANTTWLATNANSVATINIAGGSLDLGTAGNVYVTNTASATSVTLSLAGGNLTMGKALATNGGTTGTLYANYAGGTLKASGNLTSPMNVLTSVSTVFGPITNNNNASSAFNTQIGTTSNFTGGLTVDTNGSSISYGNALLGATGNGVKQDNITVTGGSGYIGAPLVTFTGGTGSPATGYAVISGGAVTGIVITSPGSYSVDPTGVTLTGGGGTGASVALSALTANATDSGLTKINGGTLTLTNANTYAGPTTINGGTLTLSGSGDINSSSGITINGSGAKFLQTSSTASTPSITLTQGTLTGSGTVGAVSVADTATAIITNNDGVAGASLTTGALTFNGAATVNTFSSGPSAAIVGDALSSNVAGTVTINPSAPSWSAGSNNLISYTGGSIGGAGYAQFALGTVIGLSPRQSALLGNSGSAITLEVSSTGEPYWTGALSNAWNNSILGNPKNWTVTGGGGITDFITGDNALFDDNATGVGPISVDIDLANVSPTSTTFNNITKDYVLGSTGGFGISTGILIKSGAGKVTIDTANSYAGGTTASGGTLVLGNASAIGTGTLTLSGGNLDSSVADLVNAGNNVQAWNSDFTFVGTQNLNLGTGAVTMSADRTVTVNANTLTVGGAVGGGAVGLTKLGAGTLNFTGTQNFTGTIAVNAGTLALSPAGALTRSNTFTGTGTLNTNPGTGSLILNGDLSGFSGTINVAAPLASSGKLNTGATSLLGAGTIVNILNGGTWFFNAATQTGITVNVSGTGNAEGFGALRTDNGTIDSTSSVVLKADSSIGGTTTTNTGTINAVISETVGPFALTKVGTNNIALGGANTYTGLTTVSAGSLILRNSSALGTTAGGTTVASGARVELDNITVTGEPITIVGTGTNFFGALQGRSGTSVWTGNVTIDAADSRIGAAAGASLEVSGVIDDGVNDYRVLYRMADSASTVIISGNNTYTGGTYVVGTGPVIASSLNKVVGGSASSSFGAPVTEANGMILFGTGSTGGILRYVGAGETTDRTIQIGFNSTTPVVGDTGGATIEASGATALSFSAPTFNTPTDAVTGTSPTRTLTLGGTNANANTIAGIIQNNQIAGNPTAAVALTKTGTGSWTLAGANSYTGATTIDQGSLAFSTTDQTLTGGLVFGSTAGSTNTGTLDLSTASATFTGAALVRTNSVTANSITVGVGKTLTLNGGLTIGYDPGSGSATSTQLTVDGGGSMAVNGTTIAIGQSLAANNSAWTNTGTLDVSSLASFSANVTNFNLGVGRTSGTGSNGVVLLSNTANTLIATTLKLGDTLAENGGGGNTTLTLGTGTNAIQADTIEIGKGKASGTGYKMAFASQTTGSPGTVTIANKLGSGAATINVANMGTTGTAGTIVASMDLRGHESTVNASTLLIAQSNNGSGTSFSGSNGTVSFNTGTFTVGTLNMGLKTGASTGTATGTLNVGGGAFTVNTAFTLGSHAGAGASVATLNLTGGTFTSNVDVTQGGGTTTSIINLDGGTLDMTGKNIGSANPVTLNAKSGALQNVAQINNGTTGLTKTTAGTLILSGTNAYTGATSINAGTLSLAESTSLTTSTSVSIGAAGTLDTSSQTTYTLPGSQPLTLVIDPTGSGTSGKIAAAGIDITSAAVTLSPTTTLDDPIYVLATYSGALTGTAFASLTGVPSGYAINYSYEGNKIALVQSGTPYSLWAAAKGLDGSPGHEAGKSDDPDADGRNNLSEFAFDGNPLSGADDGKVVGKIATVGADQVLTLTLPVRTGAAFSASGGDQLSALIDSIIYRVEGDADLGTFANTITEVTGGDATTIQTGLPALSTGWTYRTFRDAGTIPTAPKAFLRAKISE